MTVQLQGVSPFSRNADVSVASLLSSARGTPAPALPIRQRNTKIVCTVGPASADREAIRRLIQAGANVFRLNFSHGDHAWHSRVLRLIRDVAVEENAPVAIMQDLCGPKIRISRLTRTPFDVRIDDVVRITTEEHVAWAQRGGYSLEFDLASNYPSLWCDLSVGDAVLIDDGRIELLVREKQPGILVTQSRTTGVILDGKGINLPGVTLSTESVTPKDWEDLEWGILHEVDFVALSFVRHPHDLVPVHSRLDEVGSHIRLIAKIERPEAIEHLEGILALSDGLMVARGDLGVETDLARVPCLQKTLIERSRQAGKPVITATQMLESMVHAATPTRAEVSDVANAIFDGSDAIMLSAETATGAYPEQAVNVLHRVALVAEQDIALKHETLRRANSASGVAAAIVEGAATTALRLKAKQVVVYSQSGLTARLLSRCRLPMPVVAVTNIESTFRQLSLSFGVRPVYLPHIVDLPQLLREMDELALAQAWGEVGDALVVVSALDGRDGNTDTLHVHLIRS